jgi:hypothetical protein
MWVGAVLDDDKAYMTANKAERLLYGQFVNIKTGDYSIHTGPFILTTSTITKLLRGLSQSDGSIIRGE